MNAKGNKEKLMNTSIRGLRVVVLALGAVMMIWGVAAEAQTFRGTILGTVTDTSGAAIAGATVTVRNIDTGLVRTMTTSSDGSYSAPELPIGNYSVTVENSGFKTGVVSGLRVEVSSERRADLTLQAGDVTQKIEVLGDTLPQVESTGNTLGGIIESKIVTNLPVNGRDYQKLIFLVPGVAGSPDEISDSPGSYGTFSVNGARGRSNNFLLDGTDMNDGYRNDPSINEAGVFGTPATILPVEAIEVAGPDHGQRHDDRDGEHHRSTGEGQVEDRGHTRDEDGEPGHQVDRASSVGPDLGEEITSRGHGRTLSRPTWRRAEGP
jgi:hypothetical protein